MQLLLSCLSKKRSYIMTIWLVEWHKMYRDSGIESITLVYNIAAIRLLIILKIMLTNERVVTTVSMNRVHVYLLYTRR